MASMIPALLRKADPDVIVIDRDGQSVRILLRRRPSARRLTLRVSNATGDVVLTLPLRTSLATAHRFALSHEEWIAARLAKLPERVPFSAGTSIPLRGRLHRITKGTGRSAAYVSDGDEPMLVVSCEPFHVARRVRDFLYREARKDFLAAIATYAERVEKTPRRVTLRDTRSRWGSCTASGDLNFSWRLILAPPFVLDYLVAHEMAHLRELNHSPRFWALLKSVCVRVDEAEQWLRRHGSELHRYG